MLKSVSISHDYCCVIIRLANFIVTVTFRYKKLRTTFLKNIKEILKKIKHIRRFDVLGRHYHVKKYSMNVHLQQRLLIRNVPSNVLSSADLIIQLAS